MMGSSGMTSDLMLLKANASPELRHWLSELTDEEKRDTDWLVRRYGVEWVIDRWEAGGLQIMRDHARSLSS